MRHRKLGAVVGYGFLTLGIYSAYWLYATRKDLVATNGNPKSVPSFWWLFAGPLALAVFIALDAVLTSQAQPGDTELTVLNIVFILLSLVGVIGTMAIPVWWSWKFSNAVAAITRANSGAMLFGLSIVCYMFWLIPVWDLIVQEDINTMLAGGKPRLFDDQLPTLK